MSVLFCVEGSVVSVRSVVCVQFVFDTLLQIIVAESGRYLSLFCINLIGWWGHDL